MKRLGVAAALMLAWATPVCGATPQAQGPLYPGPAAGSEGWTFERTVVERDGNRSVYNTREPQYQLYLPEPAAATGAAVVMLPGGGMRVLGLGRETDREIDSFLAHGVAVILVEYRTLQLSPEEVARMSAAPPANAPPPRFPHLEIVNGNANPAKGDARMAALLQLAVADARAALKMAHVRAAEWHLDPDRIGVVGTSAGGGVGFGALLANAPADEKPDFLISIFGPSLQDVAVPAKAPPLFLVTEADHGPVTDGLLAVYSIWKAAGQRAELHVYDVPVFSMTVDLWGKRLFDWMAEQRIIGDGKP